MCLRGWHLKTFGVCTNETLTRGGNSEFKRHMTTKQPVHLQKVLFFLPSDKVICKNLGGRCSIIHSEVHVTLYITIVCIYYLYPNGAKV